jgi:subtilisin-like proprotein convertase family protein
MKILSVAFFLWTLPVFAAANQHEFCFPKNSLHLQDKLNSLTSHVDETAFNKIIDHVSKFYEPIIASHGATLEVQRNWFDPTVNAYAERTGNTWTVAMFGGLARRPEVTADGFALAICHEIGHHLGGFAFTTNHWAASEGQSDYFATQACAKKIWEKQTSTNARFRQSTPIKVKEKCDQSFATVKEQNLCYRTALAGKSLGFMLAKLADQPRPKFDTPDSTLAPINFESHPNAQCRLDTYFNGSLCPKAFPDELIPGLNHLDGQDSLGAEREAAQFSCTDLTFDAIGQRPRCWFSPRFSLKMEPSKTTREEISGNHDSSWDPGETFAINIPLENNLLGPVEGATLTIAASNSSTATNSLTAVTYPKILEGESAYAERGVSIKLSSRRQCGDRFDLNAKVAVGNWSQMRKLHFQLGEAFSAEAISEAPNLSIPDNDPTGTVRVLSGVSSEATSLVKVAVNVTHSYAGDLQFTLISPSGKEYVFYNRSASDQQDIVQTFEVSVQSEKIAGVWQLKVADLENEDSGILNSWGLEFLTMRCQTGFQLLTVE